jgi:hypothetical protein
VEVLFQRSNALMVALHGRFLDRTETANIIDERQEFYGRVVIGGSKSRQNAGDKLFVLLDERSLGPALTGISEQIEHRAAQAATLSEDP